MVGKMEGPREVGRSMNSWRESVVAAEMKKSEIGEDEIGKLGGFAGGRSGNWDEILKFF